MTDPDFPLVYSCSGCSSAAQLANHVAVRLDRMGLAEMSCIAGVGGDVPQLLRVAKSSRPVIGLDGCALACVRHCLERHAIPMARYYQLQQYGIRRLLRSDFDPEQALKVIDHISRDMLTIPAETA